ncbi:Hypothetical protein, putative [Bodo saltans]|uniref:Uncharacterized protein n=1 Tax=Bodo saltans TaxID=75058 RepID=A0A0S4J1C7_BODSA|nr:Hypothetical protein, putative [Bodo saltans]|eukprot:CUG31042.1 Hypothetical protein, putative [Bodo saltans]
MYPSMMPSTADASGTSGMTFHNISGQLYATGPNGALFPVMPAPTDLMAHSNPAMGSFHHSGPLNELTAQQQMSLSGNLTNPNNAQQQPQYATLQQQQLGSQTYAFVSPTQQGTWSTGPMPAPPPPPGPPPQHPQQQQQQSMASFGHSFGHSPSHNSNNSFQQHSSSNNNGGVAGGGGPGNNNNNGGGQSQQQQLIQRTGNVHDGLRQQGCIYIPYEGPFLDKDACLMRSRLKALNGAGLTITNNSTSSSNGGATSAATTGNGGTPPLESPSSSHGVLPTLQQALAAEQSSTPAAAGGTPPAATRSQDDIVKVVEGGDSGPTANSHQIVHFFVSSFPTEKMECAQRLLTRVLQTVASGVEDIPASCITNASEGTIAPVAFLPWVESIAFMNPSSRGSSHSFYAKVHAHNAQALLERVKGNVMMDRMGFHWAVVPASKKHLEQYSKSIWNLPQVLRHRRTEWLPCTPLILDVAMDTSRLKWQTQW